MPESEEQSVDNSRLEVEDGLFETLFSIERLRRTWRTLRRELRYITSRDVIDWSDWALTIDTSLEAIRDDVIRGEYIPSRATRIESGKSKGSFQILTSLNVQDALIYRHICDHAFEIALPRKVAGAYFSRRFTITPIGRTFEPSPDPSDRFYAVWLRYNEYRSRTLLNEPYEILVITDISNFFESIQHDLLFEYLAPLGLPRKTVGLLGRLLEAFRPHIGHSPSPRVGIPIDELDCSRELAHVFLFEHDRRITDQFGENNYVRWMDDQNIGARSIAEGRLVINAITHSLAQQRLTLNSGKTAFLTPEEVTIHFQLSINEALNNWWEQLSLLRWQMTEELRQELRTMWQTISQGETADKGNWDKILKRFYAYATRSDLPMLEQRALEDLIHYPYIADRIFLYFSRRNRGDALLELFSNYVRAGENLFENVEHSFFDSLLLLDASHEISERCVSLSREFAIGEFENQTGRPLGQATAILCLYWHGESDDAIQNLYSEEDASSLPKEVARAWLSCVAARDPSRLETPVRALFGHPSDDVFRLVRFLQALFSGRVDSLRNYKNQKPRWPLPGKFYDARVWLLYELASHGTNPNLINTLRSHFNTFRRLIYTNSERAIATRVANRLDIEF